MDIALFVNITSRAWALPILSNLHEGVAARQAPLLAATGASRTAFAQSLDHLIKIGLVERNPGYGHPLRPEFRLTALGIAAAAIANKVQKVPMDEGQDLLRRSWTLPVLTSLHAPSHFNQIKRNLQTITDRALSQSLKSMESRNWVCRSVDQAARPPRSIYRAVNTGEVISRITAPEIRFG
ncbi:winged helix-turn-helix transcriptional regulator [Sulfitobacter mediterraneus]|uniref:winged helix-turn-helix transcriptional regulator n=1 Tax=Sulfitobacter mediterraneus TaxID=83219 RepID=UPI001932D758|nr:winged helix-turn-helix transcriptional regulator [Sulfitobacter mediterraneus]MBM1634730.1 winged helix-turn-helix transcriptional regulator [Sulfitobacter mediterraneus]MBM1642549.1 winged helix-turn-helix transcriptional regulator [Sulfitobacter mediterraneus]MBM1646597.1 winged helix-turn-helix transcriptional regulator [Sulfitobacter mediterraneus]MBM1650642.1 winged helix-turn-helix transcriptional regulator [Sulfitobacter mediterraneus]MBM1654665.1 winged helix-turn-helix transcripti